jgi:HPr kinase/phosphorylase
MDGRGCQITGASGSGKSSLAIEMIALGAELVADDRVDIRRAVEGLVLSAPRAIAGMIEARGVGILGVDPAAPSPIMLVVDLGQTETERLPQRRHMLLLECPIPLLHKPATGHFPAALMQYLKAGPAE